VHVSAHGPEPELARDGGHPPLGALLVLGTAALDRLLLGVAELGLLLDDEDEERAASGSNTVAPLSEAETVPSVVATTWSAEVR
jgi:hypothetical protein